MSIKVMIAGATGWVGQALCRAVVGADDLELVAAVSRSQAGKRLGDVLGQADLDVTISASVAEGLASRPEVMVDYTSALAVKENVIAALNAGVHAVIGSSGLTDADFAEIDELARAKGIGVVAAGNFAITAVLLQRFAVTAARYLDQWEIIDYASDTKPDAPSGTTRELAHSLARVRHPQPAIPIEKTAGPIESRGANLNGTQIHSIRLPGFVIGAEVIFGADNERLSIRHDAGNGPEPYINGTLLAVRKVGDRVGLVRGLEEILN